MNNLKMWREARGLKQTELAARLRPVDARIDSSMISRFENSMCLPTPAVAEALASALDVPVSLLFGGVEQTAMSGLLETDKPSEPESMEVTELIAVLREGKGSATSRRQLAMLMDMRDRHLRAVIAEAQECGYHILNDSDGKGYYLSNSTAEIERYYRQETARAISILKRLKNTRQRLRDVGRA